MPLVRDPVSGAQLKTMLGFLLRYSEFLTAMLIDLVTNAKVFRPCQTIYWWLSAYATDCGSQIRRDSTECVHTVHWAAATAKATRKMDCEDGNVASKLTLTVFGAMSLITAGMAAMAQETPSYMGGVSTGVLARCPTPE